MYPIISFLLNNLISWRDGGLQLLRRMQTSLGSWLPSETPPMSGGLPFPPSCTTLLLPPPLLAPRSCESLCKTLRLTCCLTAPPSSPPCRGSPCTLLRCCQPAAHCQAGLVWPHSLLQLPPKPGHPLHQALASLRSLSWCPSCPWTGGARWPPGQGWLGLGSSNYGGWRQLCAAQRESQGALVLLLAREDHGCTVLSF